MDELKTELEQLADQVETVTVIKKYLIDEDIEKLEERLNKRIDDLKRDLILYFGLIWSFCRSYCNFDC